MALYVAMLLVGMVVLHFGEWLAPLLAVSRRARADRNGGVDGAGRRIANRPSGSPAHRQRGVGAGRILLKVGNRDVYGQDFRWFDLADVRERSQPSDAVVVERREYGDFHGTLREVRVGDRVVGSGPQAWTRCTLNVAAPRAHSGATRSTTITTHPAAAGAPRSAAGKPPPPARQRSGGPGADRGAGGQAQPRPHPGAAPAPLDAQRDALDADLASRVAVFATADGQDKEVRLDAIVRAYHPNSMNVVQRVGHYAARPAGVHLRSAARIQHRGRHLPGDLRHRPDGSLDDAGRRAARESSRRCTCTNTPSRVRCCASWRLAVSNLAGVPSIVFGMFGLAFFVYGVGSVIDRTFFSQALPNPTFGTGGILWAALTLALLTLPAGHRRDRGRLGGRAARQPRRRSGRRRHPMADSLARRAAECISRILTGVILAVSRGAGEVAPLMITGVVKLAPALALDGSFPFIAPRAQVHAPGFPHLRCVHAIAERGGRQPMVYTTTLLLLLLVVALNATAIVVRNRCGAAMREPRCEP
jgi:phosphate transport system permease protein